MGSVQCRPCSGVRARGRARDRTEVGVGRVGGAGSSGWLQVGGPHFGDRERPVERGVGVIVYLVD